MKLFADTFPFLDLELLALVREDGAVVRIERVESADAAVLGRLEARGRSVERRRAPLAPLRKQLGEYARGRRREFALELAPGGTAFQDRVWRRLLRVPFGETLSYGDLARGIRRPTAVRAVARANATNPIPILIPCHRVVGADGTLTGYAWGLETKERLLELEGALESAD
jgi:methylated-DNA-[protein]-cysteine S-methyltransferase